MLDIGEVPNVWRRFTERWKARDNRMDLMDTVVRGEFTEVDPDDEDLVNRSPNMIQVALEDTAAAASLVPSLRVLPSSDTDEARKAASLMEKIGLSYMNRSRMPILIQRSNQDLSAFGFFSWVGEIDPENGYPVIRWRDPRFMYPEPGFSTLDSVRRAIVARQVPLDALRNVKDANGVTYEEKVRAIWDPRSDWYDPKVVLVEWWDEDEYVIGALYKEATADAFAHRTETYRPIELDRISNDIEICPVVVGQSIKLDNEPRGQFDQVVNLLGAHIRLFALVLDYADQSVYSDMYIKDAIGQVPFGGQAVIQLGPNGEVGRVPPAVSSMSVFQELEQIVNWIHLAARWPKGRPGEIDQAIASAKFLDAATGMMNTVIREYHLTMQDALQKQLRVLFALDKKQNSGRTRRASGVQRNQQFLIDYDPKDIDLDAEIKVDYGLGFGKTPQESLVMAIQGHQAGFYPRQLVMENNEAITNVEFEKIRLDVEKLEDMAMAQLLQGLQGGTIPPEALSKVAKARMKGDSILDVFNEFVAKPAAEQAEQQLALGGGEMAMPGEMPPEDSMAPEAPAPEGLLAMLGGGGPPPEATNRLNVPLGGGAFAGSNVEMGGG